jgi:hypothetical protein
MRYLPGGAVRTADDPASEHQAAADAGADGSHQQPIDAGAGAVTGLAERRHPHVVVDRYRQPGRRADRTRDVGAPPAGKRLPVLQNHTPIGVDDPLGAEPDGNDVVAAVDRLQDQVDDRGHHVGAVAGTRGAAPEPGVYLSAVVDHTGGDLGAADVHPEPVHRDQTYRGDNRGMHTWLTDQFSLAVPVVSAPMAGVSGGALAAAVSTAGGLGMIGVRPGSTPRWLAEQIDLAAASERAYGIGLIGWGIDEEGDPLLAQVIGARPALVSISFGDVTEHVAPLHDAGIVVAMQAGNLDEALAADAVGVDVIVARGGEGGGHGRNQIATLPLLQEVLDAVDTPVLAAGGIGTRRGLAAVLAAGADGGWIGTAFMTCPEADTPAWAGHPSTAAGRCPTR